MLTCPRLSICAKQDILMAMDPVGPGSWMLPTHFCNLQTLGCHVNGLGIYTGCVRCNLFQTSLMNGTELNALLATALGIDAAARIPTLHIAELTKARMG